jgi:DNA-binding NarL/FixJ family response regulator
MTTPIRIVLADDVALFRAGLASLLERAGCRVVGEAGDAAGLIRLVDEHDPDVAVVDVRMPPTHTTEGLDAARTIRARRPEMGILVLSQYVETANALELVKASSGGVGYLLKDHVADPAAFVDAVLEVADGGTSIDPDVVTALFNRQRRVDPLAALTQREREVLALMAEGRSNTAIAMTLILSPKTIESHVSQIFSKLGLGETTDRHRRVAAVLSFLRNADAT